MESDYKYAKEVYENDKSHVNRTRWLVKGNERKSFYGRIKPQHFHKLFKQLPEGSRSLIFCVDTAQADLLNEEFAVHSNKPGSLGLVEQFNNKEINKLFTVRQLDRGIDFVDVDYVIIIQLSGKTGSPTQQMGRSLLSTAPKIITFYYPGTQDEKYLQNFLEQFNPQWVVKKKL
jgi:superfamily II DNA or RNA helicase